MKKNRNILTLCFIAILFVGLIALEHFAPKKLDWSADFNNYSTKPYGGKVIFKSLPAIFPNQTVEENNHSLFETFKNDSTSMKNLIIITDKFNPDKVEIKLLLKFVSRGNNAFVSAFDFNDLLADTLNFKVNEKLINIDATRTGNVVLHFCNKQLDSDYGFTFRKTMPLTSFTSFDSTTSCNLGWIDHSDSTNFISVKYGKGLFYFHLQPLVFSNYHFLYSNSDYGAAALSYLPMRSVMWDNYYKPNRLINDSPVRYILSQPSLQLAYYLTLITILLYMFFEAKRRQRVIPIVIPKANLSLQFIETVGRLYHKGGNHADLVRKKGFYFKEFIRERYYLSTISIDNQTIKIIAAKSGIAASEVEQLLRTIDAAELRDRISAEELIDIHNKIENFYKKCL